MERTLNCIIVDDDAMTLKIIEGFVDQTDFLVNIKSCLDPVEAGNILKKEKVDVIFLDVEMPQMTGLEFISTLKEKPQVVLITSKEKYAVTAFDLDVADYIVKPVTYPRFLKAANKVFDLLSPREGHEPEIRKNKLFIKSDSQLVGIPIKDIIMVEALADYVKIHTEGKRYTVYSSMKGISEKLPKDQFMRVHRSYIINLDKITSIEDNSIVIGEKLIPVGVTYQKNLMARLNLL